ncbi:MAG: ATP-binding cassette domain-containing protein [Polyangiaceae bacterium]
MPCICADRLGFSYSDRISILQDVSFRLPNGWYGLVGANGAGKTTLVRLVAGELRPTHGRIWIEPEDSTTVHCPQEVLELTADLIEFAERVDRDSQRQRGRLDLDVAALERWATLSPGERKRWQIASALSRCPDVLIIDEPTNHLDEGARRYLIRALADFAGVGLAISHDRTFLDELTRATLRVHAGKVTFFPASATDAMAHWASERNRLERDRREQIREVERLEERVVVARRDQMEAQKSRSAGARMKNRRDHDGSSFARTGRANFAEAQHSRKAALIAEQLTRRTNAIPSFEVDRTLGRSVFVDFRPAPMSRLFSISTPALTVGNEELLRDVNIEFMRDTRVHLAGPNGAGKSTLVRALLAGGPANTPQVLYLPQELTHEEIEADLELIRALPRQERGRVLSILAALGTDPDCFLDAHMLSPGEARKSRIALGLARHAWALVLDEPTNHLDLPTIERLESALASYPGAILLVSHDAQFAAACTTTRWEIADGRVHVK